MRFLKILLIWVVLYQVQLNAMCSTPGCFDPVPGSPFAAGDEAADIAFSPVVSGNLFAAVVNTNDDTVTVYSVNQTTGVFTPVAGSPFPTGAQPVGIDFSPLVSGNLFAAVTNNVDNNISVYQVNQTTGAFTPVAGSPFAAGSGLTEIAFSPLASGNLFLAAVNALDDTVSVYNVNQTTGFLTPVIGSPFVTGDNPNDVEFSPIVSGNLFAAITNSSDNTVSIYQVNQTTGVFTPVVGSPFATGIFPIGVAFSPVVSGNLFAAVTNLVSNTVSVYSVNQTTGFLTPVAGSPFATGTTPFYISFSPVAAGFLFAMVPNVNDDTVSVYEVNQSSGSFANVTGSPFTVGDFPRSTGFSPFVLNNLFAAVVNNDSDNVSVFKVFLEVPCTLAVSPSLFTTTISRGQSSTISFTISGGVAPYTVTWSDGFVQTLNSPGTFSRTVAPTKTTTYTIDVNDSNGTQDCTITVRAIVQVVALCESMWLKGSLLPASL
jgi:6-phosphogluconolactonase